MEEKLLSVIVPVYNQEKYLKECIESIVNQTYRNLEIILVDDGSTDGSKEICDRYAIRDTRIKVIHQKNMGMIGARYSGVKAAYGEYIIFCDSDDFIELAAYEHLMSVVNVHDVDMVTSGCYRYYDENHQVMDICTRAREGLYDKKQIRDELIPIMLWEKKYDTWALDPSLCFKVIRKSILLEQYHTISQYDFSFGEDSATIYPAVLKMGRIYVTHRCSYFHRQRQGNETTNYIADRNFPDKLLELYHYLYSVFEKDRDAKQLLMQLDMFFARAAQYIKSRYPQKKTVKTTQKVWMFPYQEVAFGSRIILYGAGKVGRCFYDQLVATDYCKEVLWVDKNPPSDLENVISVKAMEFTGYDYIVIAIESEDVCRQIKNQLVQSGFEINRVIISNFERQKIYV